MSSIDGPAELEVDVEVELADLIRSNLWFLYRNWTMKFSVVSSIFISSLVALLVLFTEGNVPTLLPWVPIVLIFLTVLTPAIIVLTTVNNFSSLKDFQKRVHYRFSVTGYEADDGKSSSKVNWEGIQKVVETNHAFHMFFLKTFFLVIPKRCLRGNDQVETLREIFKSALGQRARLKE